MDSAALDELRALRARAYGPHADIELDAAAVQRLRELEAQSSGSTTRSPVAAATEVTSTLPPEPEPDAEREAEAVAQSERDDDAHVSVPVMTPTWTAGGPLPALECADFAELGPSFIRSYILNWPHE